MLHLIGTDHTSKDAARAIAGTLLVNPSGTNDGWYSALQDQCRVGLKNLRARRRLLGSGAREFPPTNILHLPYTSPNPQPTLDHYGT